MIYIQAFVPNKNIAISSAVSAQFKLFVDANIFRGNSFQLENINIQCSFAGF